MKILTPSEYNRFAAIRMAATKVQREKKIEKRRRAEQAREERQINREHNLCF